MILWTIKLLSNVRKAIAGRNHPHQLAWAVAFGLVLGLVPHGNLVAVAWLLIVLSLNINHSMVAITAIGSGFLAGRLDLHSHRVGDYLLSQPRVYEGLMTAWQWPLVPWTNLNNTVVLGSLTISLLAMLPVFAITYPVFQYVGRKYQAAETAPVAKKKSRREKTRGERSSAIVVVDQGHTQVARPHHTTATAEHRSVDRVDGIASSAPNFTPVPEATTQRASTSSAQAVAPATKAAAAVNPSIQNQDSPRPANVAVETRVDVIRISDYRDSDPQHKAGMNENTGADQDGEPMDEAFRYLLHQLRDTQQRKAA